MNLKLVRIIALLALVAVVAVMVAFLPQVKEHLFAFIERVQGLGVAGAVLLGVLYVVACMLFVPGWIFSVGAGYLYHLWWGSVVASLASTTGATAAFLLGRTLLRDWVKGKVASRPRFRALDEAVRSQGFKIVLLTRLSPAFPFNLLNYAYGITNVRLRDFVLASWIGMLPGTLLYVYFGTAVRGVTQLQSGSFPATAASNLLFGIGLVATVAVTLLVTRIARKALRDAIPPTNAEPAAPSSGQACP